MNTKTVEKRRMSGATALTLLCWLVYATSYIGKLSYSANIPSILLAFEVSRADAGLVSTFFFFAYGIGQVVNGICCKHYPLKYVLFASLLVGSGMNLLVGLVPSFAAFKFFWLLNGAAMSFLWTGLIRLLSETLHKRDIGRAVLLMGTTVATGTFIVYGMSSLFTALGVFRLTFYIAAGLLLIAATVWFLLFDRLVLPLRREREAEREEAVIESPSDGEGTGRKPRIGRDLGLLFAILALFAVINNFVKDGLTTWTPKILSDLYKTPEWLSILLTLLLAVMAIGGAMVAMKTQKRTHDFVGTCTVFYAVSAILIAAVILLLGTPLIPVTIASFAIVSCLMAGVNNVITSMMPLRLKDRVNSGRMAGLLNSFCYLGSTVTSYGLGAIADGFGWSAVFYVLLAAAALAAVIGILYLILCKNRITE